MLDHLVPTVDTLSDLDRRRPRRGPHLPQEHHDRARYRARLVCQPHTPHAVDQHKHEPNPKFTPDLCKSGQALLGTTELS